MGDDTKVWREAVQRGLLTRDQLLRASLCHKEGKYPSLQEALLDLGFISQDKITELFTAEPRETLIVSKIEMEARRRSRELTPADLSLARALNDLLLVSPKDIEECAEICRNSRNPVPLSYVLVDRGLIDAQQLEEIVRPAGASETSGNAPRVEILEGPDIGRRFALQLGTRNIVGRGTNVAVSLSDPFVSRTHCVLEVEGDKIWCQDLGSRYGTSLAGRPLSDRTPIPIGAEVKAGRTRFRIVEKQFDLIEDRERGIRIESRQLSKIVASRDTGKDVALIDNISLVIHPGEFVVILGPSGSGKSTFMDAINGRRRANRGQVMYGGVDFYSNYDLFRTKMGYVPQRDIVHSHLPVKRALSYTAALRVPDAFSADERALDGILKRLGLTERAKTGIGHLSGGQIKRVSLAVELVSNPNVLFLDEATSGLDAGTERKMMGLFRQIADRGKTVVCITHNLENIAQSDLVVVLCRGKLVYYGPPEEMTNYFEVPTPSDLYDRLEDRPAEEWADQYAKSELHPKYVQNRLSHARPTPDQIKRPMEVGAIRQFWYLTMRYFETTMRDWRNLAILIGQAPLIALITAIVFKQNNLLLFMMTIAAVWFGCLNASKEIVKELEIYKRERMVNLRLLPYLLSKIVVLILISAAQCALLVWIVHQRRDLDGAMWAHFAVLLNVATAALMLGLLISSVVNTTDKAIALVPLLLIPQIIFTVYPAVGWRMEPLNKLVAQITIMSFWAFDALRMIEVQAIASDYGVDYRRAILDSNLILGAFTLAEFIATMIVLKRKDRQLVQV